MSVREIESNGVIIRIAAEPATVVRLGLVDARCAAEFMKTMGPIVLHLSEPFHTVMHGLDSVEALQAMLETGRLESSEVIGSRLGITCTACEHYGLPISGVARTDGWKLITECETCGKIHQWDAKNERAKLENIIRVNSARSRDDPALD